MRKLIIIIVLALLSQACSALEIFSTQEPTSTSTPTPTATVTLTPTLTFTPTATITPTPRNTATLIDIPTNTPFVWGGKSLPGFPTQAFTPTPASPTGGFESIHLSEGSIYYGTCKQNYTKMTVKVEHPEDVRKVYLFYRLETAKPSGKTTPWTGTVTDNDGFGYFLYTLRANNIPERKNFIKAYVHYQFVSENAEQEIIGRTHVYTRNIILRPCK